MKANTSWCVKCMLTFEEKTQGQQPLTDAAAVLKVQRSIYDCKDTAKLPGTLVRKEGAARTKDRQINNCYDGFKITYDFYATVFGRNSLDDRGLPLIGCVHYKEIP